ncbi:MAG: GAF domain-containing protein, partial [Elusimicrobia bacterium]|nr:GAF domain-containing protein [Elusimicrobiota bacterium]
MKNLAFIHYLISAIILFILLSLYLRKYRHNTQLIENLEEEREKNRSYIEDLDTLLSMLTRFQGLGMSYTKENDLQDFCNLIVEYSTDLLNTKMGSLMLKNKSLNKLEIVAARGLSEDVINSTKIPIGEGIAGRVAQNGKPIYCEDIVNDIRFMRNSRVKYSSSSFISVPLKVKNKVIGVLNVNSKKKDQLFTQRDLKLLSILADQAAVVIENMQLYGDMKSMYLGTMQTLAKAIEAKDPYTLGHTERVAKFAVMIARRMDLPPKLVRNIEYAALIHDIGKIGIEDSILTKPSKLSESEFEFIKKHPAIGEQIIAPVEFLTNVAP